LNSAASVEGIARHYGEAIGVARRFPLELKQVKDSSLTIAVRRHRPLLADSVEKVGPDFYGSKVRA
jgi:hypothetical protein